MSDRPKRRVPRRVREQQIIDAAIQVFAKRGYHAAAVDEIAELAGISKPMVYLYLESKEGLFLACLRREAGRLGAALAGAAGRRDDPPELRLYGALEAFFSYVSEHRDSWVVLHRQAPELTRTLAAALAEARREVMNEVTALVRAGIDASDRRAHLAEDDAEFVAHALVGAADSLTDWMERRPGRPPERVALRLMNMVWIGMREVLEGESWPPPAGP